MQKTLLEVYISRVANGDLSYMDRLCAQLTDRLCYLPVLTVERDSGTERVEVLRFEQGGIPFVPLFTSEKKLNSWLSKHPECSDSIEVLGGDLCAVLGADSGVLIDPEAEVTAMLPPEAVAKIACEVLFNNEPVENEIAASKIESTETYTTSDEFTAPVDEVLHHEEPERAGYSPAPQQSRKGFDPFEITPAEAVPEFQSREESVKVNDDHDEVTSTTIIEAPHGSPSPVRGPLSERDTQTIYPPQNQPKSPPTPDAPGGGKRSIMGLFKTKRG